MRKTYWVWGGIYLLVMILLTVSLFRVRDSALRVYGTGQAQEEWDTWRQAAEKIRGPRPDGRPGGPRSDVPPALALFAEHFPAILSTSVLVSTALFITFAFVIQGMLQQSARRGSAPHASASQGSAGGAGDRAARGSDDG